MNHPRDRNRTSLLSKVKAAQGLSQVGKSPFTDARLLPHQTAGSITQ
jgi:hypothetical protein